MRLRLQCAVCACLAVMIFPVAANAALLSRLGGLAVYDTDLKITWLANANLAATNTFGVADIDANGSMKWDTAISWVAAMNSANYLGFGDWNLPATPVPDSSCTNGNSLPDARGLDCTGSEMGHLFNVEGVTATAPDLFSNIQSDFYWSVTDGDPSPASAWLFSFDDGSQATSFKSFRYSTWAVRPGDVSTVPVPATAWLFGSGLICLFRLAHRKN